MSQSLSEKFMWTRSRKDFAIVLYAPADPSGLPAYNKGACFNRDEYHKTLGIGGFPIGTVLQVGKQVRIVIEGLKTEKVDKE